MLTDARSNWPEHWQVKVTARFATGMDEPETLVGGVLKETGDVQVFTPHISDTVIYYGVHIIPKSNRIARY
jgi:hypothetical protein